MNALIAIAALLIAVFLLVSASAVRPREDGRERLAKRDVQLYPGAWR